MMKLLTIALTIILTAFCLSGKAQSYLNTVSAVNAKERQILKDSIGLSDNTITKLFDQRDKFFQQVEQYINSKSYTEAQLSSLLAGLADDVNKNAQKLLGDTAYEKYVALIQAWANKRSTKMNKPLASTN